MYSFLPITNEKEFVITLGTSSPRASTLNSLIEQIWQHELKLKNNLLNNGKILSALSLHPQKVRCEIVEYKQWIAQKNNPELFSQLAIRPLAVSGLLKCADGIVFGKRSTALTQDAGLWELVPSGSIEANYLQASVNVDFLATLFAELQEEVGIARESVSHSKPFCLVADKISHVVDVGILIESRLSFATILKYYNQLASKEYSEIIIVPISQIEEFVQAMRTTMVGVSSILIQHFFNLPMTLSAQEVLYEQHNEFE